MDGTPAAAEPALSVCAPALSPLAVEVGADGVRRLRCGERFDVLRVPEPAGRWALRRLIGYGQPALMPGPVALEALEAAEREVDGAAPQGGACLFLVAPGAKEDLPELLEWLDWGGIDLGLRAYGAGETIAEPTVWLHDANAPAPEVIALLATIAECCSRRLLTGAVPPQRPQARDAAAADASARDAAAVEERLAARNSAGEAGQPSVGLSAEVVEG